MHSLIIDENHKVWSKGINNYGQLGIGEIAESFDWKKILGLSKINRVSTSYTHSIFLDFDGNVLICGNNNNCVLGLKTSLWSKILDRYQKKITSPEKIIKLSYISKVRAGVGYSLFLDFDGKVWSCGNNTYGQLGLGDFKNRSIPQKIKNLPIIIKVRCTESSSLLIDNNNNAWVFGKNNFGQLGLDHLKAVKNPVMLNNGFSVIDGDCASFYIVLIDENGNNWSSGINTSIEQPKKVKYTKVRCFGNNVVFLDDEKNVWYSSKSGKILPIKIRQVNNIKKIFCYYHHLILIDEENSIWFIDSHIQKLDIKWKPYADTKKTHVKSSSKLIS